MNTGTVPFLNGYTCRELNLKSSENPYSEYPTQFDQARDDWMDGWLTKDRELKESNSDVIADVWWE